MRVKKRIIAAALSLAMMLGLAPAGIPQAGTPFSVTAQAAKKKVVKKKKKTKKTKKTKKKAYKENPRLSKMKISLRNKKMTTVRVSGTKKGISVSTSDRSIAAVSKSGKYAFRIKAAKKKKGIAVIRVKTSRGYRYVFVQVGGRTNMSGKTRAWAQTAGFIRVAVVQSSTPVAQNPVTVPTIPIQQQQKPTVTQPETQAQTQPETIQNRYKDYGNGVTRGDDGYYYYNGRAYFTKEDADYDRLSEINNAISAVPAEYPYTYKFSQEELELLKNRGELNGVAYSQYEAIQDQKKNGSFYAVLDQYRDYCKNYDKQILITKCGMNAYELANPEQLSDARKLQILNKLCTYIEYNIPYIGGEEEKSEQEPLRLWGHIEDGVIVKAESPVITTQCIRVPVLNGHTAAVFVKFRKKPTKEQLIEKLVNFSGLPQELDLPSAPKQMIQYIEEDNRPQVTMDVDYENGMGVSVGRLREDTVYDYKFVGLSHNTVRGAAGGAVLCAETLKAKGYITKK